METKKKNEKVIKSHPILRLYAAKIEVFKYIEGWFNRKRIHGSIGYLTPQEMEDLTLSQAV
ncbi:MAG TPA: hypothetical protein GXZ58_07950 [Bacilli bacterium]|nr:hypothetical protein [Bacilli bacterium]